MRYRLSDSLGPKKRIDTLISGLAARQLPSHTLAIDVRGNLIVNIGAASNGCAAKEGVEAPGRDPCPELETSGGIWSFKTDKINQTIKDGTRIATGLHNAVALAVNPGDTMVYAVSHDRDGLHDLWPQSVFGRGERDASRGGADSRAVERAPTSAGRTVITII